WHARGMTVAIFSSGSVIAQKLLFANSVAGNLTPYISDYFDTTTGSKSDAESYRRIVAVLKRSPAEIAFISDVTAEFDAARSARLQTWLSKRPGNRPQPENAHSNIHSFDEVFP